MHRKTFSNDSARGDLLSEILGEQLKDKPYCAVWVKGCLGPGAPSFGFPEDELTRALIIFEGKPVSTERVQEWRAWARGKGVMDLKTVFVESGVPDSEINKVVKKKCSEWFRPIPKREPAEVTKEQWVRLPTSQKKYDPAQLLVESDGIIGDCLNHMDLIAGRFCRACTIEDGDKKKYLKDIRELLGENAPSAKPLSLSAPADRLPSVLLLGETGSGKTLFAHCMAQGKPVTRVPIPEYLNKEDMFEYDLFGYAKGAFTGGKEDGSLGLLLEHVGEVIFLDEIAEANGCIQAKLLAYLDDCKVRSRGWMGEPFNCPTLLVAATNRTLVELQKEYFRQDLLYRFTDIVEVPSLGKRMENFRFILDGLLQNNDINAGGKIVEIGKEACECLSRYQFSGNFRVLEKALREACERAARDGRDYICKADIPEQKTDPLLCDEMYRKISL